MVNKEQKYELIDRYAHGTLRGEALSEFEALMEADSNFAGEVALHVQATRALASVQTKRLDQIVAEIGSEHGPDLLHRGMTLQQKRATANRFLFISAGVTLLMISTVMLWYLFARPTTNAELMASYFKPYANTAALMSTEDQQQVAATIDSNVEGGQSTNPTILFFAGNALLEKGNTAQAQQAFEAVLELDSDTYREPAQWYLALAHLGQDHSALAMPILENIASTDHPYSQQAMDLLEQLQ